MRTVALLVVLGLLCFCVESSSANANGEHIYLSCAHGHSETVTTYADGRVVKQSQAEPFTYPVDIDVEHGTINQVFHFAPSTISAARISAASEFTPPTKYDYGYRSYITIDRLSGQLQMTASAITPLNCIEQWGKSSLSCPDIEITTVYQCVPASPRF